MDVWRRQRDELNRREAEGLLRRPVELETACGPRVRVDGREVVCFCSNDYLSLAADPVLKAAAVAAIERWGVGAGASRLVSGTMTPHRRLERRLAEFKGVEAAVVTSTGWQANHVAIQALAGAGDLVFCDKLNHASILTAAFACGARARTYPHGNVARLEALLRRHRGDGRRCLIVTDSVFSMDGDLAPLSALADLRDRHDCLLMVDEAHATGVLGEGGRGAAELLGVEGRVDVTVGTLSKALGCLGGFVAGRGELIDTIVNAGRAYIYTTALPPALCAAALAALDVVRAEPARRVKVLGLAERLRERLAVAGFGTSASRSQIVPVHLGEAARAVEVSRRLLEAGFLVPAIRPPTVPKGASRLRISLCAGHQEAEVDRLAGRLAECR